MELIGPSVTRWNSEFRVITKVVGLSEDQLRDICDKVLSVAIDIFQDENKCYLGFVILILLSLKTKFVFVMLSCFGLCFVSD